MDISLEAYRNRIGIFSSSRHIFKPRKLRSQSYKSSTKGLVRFRIFRTLLLLTLFLLNGVYILHEERENYQLTGSTVSVSKPVSSAIPRGQVSNRLTGVYILHNENQVCMLSGSTATVSNPVPSVIFWAQVSDCLSQHLGIGDVDTAHSAAPVGIHLDRELIMITSPSKFSGFSDSKIHLWKPK